MHYHIRIAYQYKIHINYTNEHSLERKGVGTPFLLKKTLSETVKLIFISTT